MKLGNVFVFVLGLHVLGAVVLLQPGCQSQPDPSPETTEVSQEAPAMGGNEELDPAFNANLPAEGQSSRPMRQAPRRPETSEGWVRTPGPGSTTRTTSVEEPLRPLEPALPPTSSASRSMGTGREYIVQRGDTLWMISRQQGVSLNALLDANGLTRESVIRPGDVLVIRGGGLSAGTRSGTTTSQPMSSTPESSGTTYTVRPGDTLSGIAARYGVTVRVLQQMNGLPDTNLFAGQTLTVPAGGPTARTQGPSLPEGMTEHIVSRGETPSEIAARYGMTTAELMRENGIEDPRTMRVGQILFVRDNTPRRAPGSTANRTTAPAERPRREPPPAPAVEEEVPLEPLPATDPLEDEDVPLIPVDDQ